MIYLKRAENCELWELGSSSLSSSCQQQAIQFQLVLVYHLHHSLKTPSAAVVAATILQEIPNHVWLAALGLICVAICVRGTDVHSNRNSISWYSVFV